MITCKVFAKLDLDCTVLFRHLWQNMKQTWIIFMHKHEKHCMMNKQKLVFSGETWLAIHSIRADVSDIYGTDFSGNTYTTTENFQTICQQNIGILSRCMQLSAFEIIRLTFCGMTIVQSNAWLLLRLVDTNTCWSSKINICCNMIKRIAKYAYCNSDICLNILIIYT